MNIWQEIKSFVNDFNGPYKIELTRNTLIEDDLHITGDHANEFIYEFAQKFNVDLDNFEVGRYFEPEGFDPIGFSFLIRKFSKLPLVKKSNHNLTLGDLEKWIEIGHWKDLKK